MADEENLMRSFANKGRSASVCYPTAGTKSAVRYSSPPVTPPASSAERSRTRYPAVRTQSARLPSGKSERRRTQPLDIDAVDGSKLKPGTNEKINDPIGSTSPPLFRRRGSHQRKAKSVYQHSPARSKTTAYLDVPRTPEPQDENSYRLRSFSFSSKGIINRGDSFRRKHHTSSNDGLPPKSRGPEAQRSMDSDSTTATGEEEEVESQVVKYNVSVLGAKSVGKTSLISQFMTSEAINPYDRQKDVPSDQIVSIMLNGIESELCFHEIKNSKTFYQKDANTDAFIVVYSVVDKTTFQRAEAELNRLHDAGWLMTRPAILVGNKIDLARSRTVSTQDGKCLACTFQAKFIETSVGINHNVDELLVGILNQVRLKKEQVTQESPNSGWYKNRGITRATMKARQMITWIFGKEDSKFKNCENLNIL